MSLIQREQYSVCITKALLLLIAASLLSRIVVAVLYEINWDEFFFLSKIYLYRQGELTSTLQTAYVHVFSWLTYLPGDEVDKIVVGRLVMLAFQCGTMWFLFRIGRDLLSVNAALFSLLAYGTFSFVILHGASFRADPLIGFLMMWATCLIYEREPDLKCILAVSLLVSTATIISVKAIFLMPVMAIIALIKATDSGRFRIMIQAYIGLGILTISIFIIFFFLNKWSMAADALSTTIERTSSYSFAIQIINTFPRRSIILETVMVTDPFYYMAVLGGVLLLISRLIIKADGLKEKWLLYTLFLVFPLTLLISYRYAYIYFVSLIFPLSSLLMGYLCLRNSLKDRRLFYLLVLATPLTTLAFYRNAYPYFFPYILPTTSLLAGYLWFTFEPVKKPLVAMVIPLILTMAYSWHIYRDGIQRPIDYDSSNQRQVLTVIHQMFPKPVAYLDGNSMVSSFPKAGFFMSTWGLKKYFKNATPVISQEIVKQKPKFIVLNSSTATLENAFSRGQGLLQEDVRTLQENYTHHWGRIYIAGKHVSLAAEESRVIEMLIPGNYTLESPRAVLINGNSVNPNDVIHIPMGNFTIATEEAGLDLILRYGENIYRPLHKPMFDMLYEGFNTTG